MKGPRFYSICRLGSSTMSIFANFVDSHFKNCWRVCVIPPFPSTTALILLLFIFVLGISAGSRSRGGGGLEDYITPSPTNLGIPPKNLEGLQFIKEIHIFLKIKCYINIIALINLRNKKKFSIVSFRFFLVKDV